MAVFREPRWTALPCRPFWTMRARKIDIIVVSKVDRLTRSLADFAKLVELFDEHGVSFVSITQSFNTTSSTGSP
jgi:site-specific DNA recombinase